MTPLIDRETTLNCEAYVNTPLKVKHILEICPKYASSQKLVLKSQSITDILRNHEKADDNLVKFLRSTGLHDKI